MSHVLTHVGSTRAVSLVRLLLPLLVWTELGKMLRLVESLGVPWKVPLSFAVGASSLAMLLGWHARLASLATGASVLGCWWLLGEVGGDIDFVRHHVYALGIASVWLSLTPCGGSFSVDRALATRRGQPTEETGDLWATLLIRMQVVAIYLFAAYDKTDGVFGAHYEQTMRAHLFGSDRLPQTLLDALHTVAYASVALEWLLPLALLWRPTRTVALIAGVGFHFLVYWTLSVGTFSSTMVVLYLAFVDPQVVHRWVGFALGEPSPRS